MAVYDGIFPLGLGTSRFPINGFGDESGIESAVQLVLRALEAGVNYIDTSHKYSGGISHTVLKYSFARTQSQYSVTLKSDYAIDKTSDGVRRRVESSLKDMGINRASFFLAWTIKSYTEFEAIMRKDGIYEGAVKLKDEGIIDHICFSTHAPVEDIIKIMGTGAFEGVTISYSLLNGLVMQPVLDYALERGIGVAVMNPLGGGLIPQNRDYFAFARNSSETSSVQAALRFVKVQPGVNIVITGPANISEFEESLEAFTHADMELYQERLKRISVNLKKLDNFCTGCRYCEPCPNNVPVLSLMQSRNVLLFNQSPNYDHFTSDLIRNLKIFQKLEMDFGFIPDTHENLCVRCGLCEQKCTQQLKICDAIADIYKKIKDFGFSLHARRERLDELLNNKGYRKVGIYPSGLYAMKVLDFYRKFFGDPAFNILLFNSDPKFWGMEVDGFTVHAPKEIPMIKPDVILICSYNYGDEIFESLKHYEDDGISILQLTQKGDLPWVFGTTINITNRGVEIV